MTRPIPIRCVIILRGIPGAGKTTRADKVYPGAMYLSADDFFTNSEGRYAFDPSKLTRAHGDCLRTFINFVRPRMNSGYKTYQPSGTIVVDNTNCTVAEIAPYAAIAIAYGWELQIETVICDPEVAAKRNVHGVPADYIRARALVLAEELKYFPSYWPHVAVWSEAPKAERDDTYFSGNAIGRK